MSEGLSAQELDTTNTYDPRHPHERDGRDLAPILDPEGRCLICGLDVIVEKLAREIPLLAERAEVAERENDHLIGLTAVLAEDGRKAEQERDQLRTALAEQTDFLELCGHLTPGWDDERRERVKQARALLGEG